MNGEIDEEGYMAKVAWDGTRTRSNRVEDQGLFYMGRLL